MAASAWELYNRAKFGLANGTIKLGVDTFRMQLHKGSSNASSLVLVTATALDNPVNTGGYTAGGKALTTEQIGTQAYSKGSLIYRLMVHYSMVTLTLLILLPTPPS